MPGGLLLPGILIMMPGRVFFGRALFFLAACLAGCAALLSPREAAWQFASDRGFIDARLSDPHLKALLRQRPSGAGGRLTVYIEGDGAPWPFRDAPPADPTPLRRTVLGMAAADPSALVAYLGRPCQYLEPPDLERCDPMHWTLGRFSPDAVAVTVRAVDALKRTSGATDVALVGYSGGGAMAALVAAARSDVGCLVTIAAPLDTDSWTDAIGVSRLIASRNPLEVAPQLAGLAQTHFRGRDDRLVPPATTARFLARLPAARVADLEGVDHTCCWQDAWPRLRESTCLVR